MEEGAPPEVPESLAYTRTRGVGVLDRLSRWLVQGPGLLLLFFLAFVFSIAKEPEIGLNLLGILLTLWVVSPLLGKRPLAHPWRLTALLLPATLMLSVSVVMVRCGIENVELSKDPIVYFTRVGLDVVEKATEPKVVVWTAVAALGLLALGRFLAARNPWLELSASPPRWRKIASLLILGLIFGSLATVPIAAKLAWSQPWLNTSIAETQPLPRKKSEPGDLGSQFPEYLNDVGSLETSPQERVKHLLRAATKRLNSPKSLTQSDYRVMALLLKHGAATRTQDPDLSEFTWAVFIHQGRGGHVHYSFHKAFAQHVLVAMGQASELTPWQKKMEALPAIEPVQPSQLDGAVANHLRKTGEESGRYPYGLRLFGIETPLNKRTLTWRAEMTPQLLLYIRARRQKTPDELVDSLFQDQYVWPLNKSWRDLSGPIIISLRELPGRQNHDYLRTRKLTDTIVKLRTERLKSGRYPEQVENLPVAVHYISGSSTATVIDEMNVVEIKLL